jgi:ElaA protein
VAPTWHDRGFAELTARELYAIVALREAVFVVEQRCAYLDADGIDPQCRHLWAAAAAEPAAEPDVRAYLRYVPAGVKYAEASLGRVVVAPVARGTGLGRALMRRALDGYGDRVLRIAAQAHLERFYAELGFRTVSAPFLEDDIPHLYMLRDPTPRAW